MFLVAAVGEDSVLRIVDDPGCASLVKQLHTLPFILRNGLKQRFFDHPNIVRSQIRAQLVCAASGLAQANVPKLVQHVMYRDQGCSLQKYNIVDSKVPAKRRADAEVKT